MWKCIYQVIWIGHYSHMLSWFTEMQCIYCCWVGLCAAFSKHLQKGQLWKMSLTWFVGENSLGWVRYFTVLSLFAAAWFVNCVINISHNFLSHIREQIIHQYQLKSSSWTNARCQQEMQIPFMLYQDVHLTQKSANSNIWSCILWWPLCEGVSSWK